MLRQPLGRVAGQSVGGIPCLWNLVGRVRPVDLWPIKSEQHPAPRVSVLISIYEAVLPVIGL